jgi:hypothetical protein
MGQRMDSINLNDLTLFGRTILTSSSGPRIKGCRPCWNEDSKSCTLGRKTQKIRAWIIFLPKKSHPRRYLKLIFYSRLSKKFLTAGLEDSLGPEHHKNGWFLHPSSFHAIGPNLAIFSPTMGATGQRKYSVNLEDLTMFRRTVLTLSSGLRIKGSVLLERGLQILCPRNENS